MDLYWQICSRARLFARCPIRRQILYRGGDQPPLLPVDMSRADRA
jgi:hypothetical protein